MRHLNGHTCPFCKGKNLLRYGVPAHDAASQTQQPCFDLITLMDVIEHVEKPDPLIVEAAARLAPSGVLVAETGNYQSAGRVQSQGAWWNDQVDHRWCLTPLN